MALRMRKFCFIGGLALALVAAPYSFGQQPILPDHFGSWQKGSCAMKPLHTTLEETGEQDSQSCQYLSGARSLSVLVGKYKDPSSAYEVYTGRLTPDMHPSTVGELSGVDKDQLLMLLGDLVLDIRDYHNVSTADLQQLAKLVKGRADKTPLPPIRSYLPEGFSDGTQRYSLGPAGFGAALERLHRSEYSTLARQVGFENGAEVMLAEYRKRDDSAVLVLIEYPTPQLAEQHMHHLQTILPGIAKVGEAKIERKGSLLSLVLGATSPAYAASLRSGINYETEVTWNEPSHTLTDPPWLVIVSRIFTATGIFLVIAIVLGVAFGGLRVVTKRLFPGKVFDRRKDIEVLQLGLSGKRIDSDFS
jgi:hypothetical protein